MAKLQDGKPKVLDTYLRAIEKLANLVPDVEKLSEEVAAREAEVLNKLLGLIRPVLPRIVGPVTLREPWLEGKEKGTPKTLKEPGIIVERTFSQHREGAGTHVHRSALVVLNERGKLVSVDETAQWTEPARADVRWNVEATEVEVTPDFAAEHLRGILVGLLDVLRDRLAREIDDKRELKDRLERLEEAERVLG